MSLRPIRASDRLEQELLLRIFSGELKDILPSQRQLCQAYGLSRSTVGVVLARLEARGLCVAVQGTATIIAPLIHAMDHKLLLRLIKHGAAEQAASKMLYQLFELATQLLSEAAAQAASKRVEVHIEALQQVVVETIAEAPVRGQGEEARVSPSQEFNVWKVVAGAADNIGTTAALNALEALWADPDLPLSRSPARLVHLEALLRAIDARDSDQARLSAKQLLEGRIPGPTEAGLPSAPPAAPAVP